jgi:2-oxoglutarate dehydrogenase E2 component (dihydrolipoamide succinyltransferase)
MESGTLIKKLYNEGDVVKVGEAIAIINTSGDSNQPVILEEEPALPVQAIERTIEVAKEIVNTKAISENRTVNKFYSPLVTNIAKTEGISTAQLDTIPGTGQYGRVTKKDILSFIKNRQSKISAPQNHLEPTNNNSLTDSKKFTSLTSKDISLHPGDEIIEMGRMRKLIADHMVMSKQTSPHVTSFVEADVTNLVNWRNKIKNDFKVREGENFTYTPIFIEAIVKAIKDFPMINVAVNGNQIIKRKNINIGMAAALPSGNLIVPVIKNADFMNLTGLAKTVNDMASRARSNKLSPDEIQDGTYTVTNVGTFGNVLGTPIINQPQVAIMAMGAIVKKPAVIETEHGDLIGIRHKMFLSHSYDHRVVDGALGGMFVRRVSDYLEQWDENREV